MDKKNKMPKDDGNVPSQDYHTTRDNNVAVTNKTVPPRKAP
jgi:hypothetical protein